METIDILSAIATLGIFFLAYLLLELGYKNLNERKGKRRFLKWRLKKQTEDIETVSVQMPKKLHNAFELMHDMKEKLNAQDKKMPIEIDWEGMLKDGKGHRGNDI